MVGTQVTFILAMASESATSAERGQKSAMRATPSTSGMFAPVTKKPKPKAETPTKTPVSSKRKKKEDRVKAEDVKANEKQLKRKTIIYHDEEGRGNTRYSYVRRSSGGSTDDYVKGSTSDEYKRRIHEAGDKYLAERLVDESHSDYFFNVTTVGLALLIVILVVALLVTWTELDDTHKDKRSAIPMLQVKRFTFGSISEEIDCSIHMKRRNIQGDSPHDVVRQGLICLYALAPHTVHELSSLQMVFSYIQTKRGIAKAVEMLKHEEFCYVENTTNCDYRQLPMFTTGFGYLNGTLRSSRLASVWVEPENVNTSNHRDIWSRSFLNGTTFGYGNGTVKNRQFRLSNLFLKVANETKESEKLLTGWNKRFPYINISNLSRNDTIVITQGEASAAADIFATNNMKRSNVDDDLFRYVLGNAKETGVFFELVFPKPNVSRTLSFLSAFIIKVVFDAFNQIQPKDEELSLNMMSLNAQHIALQMLKGTREWSGKPEDPSLLDMSKKASDKIVRQTFEKGHLGITRNSTDRITSVVVWEVTKYHEWMTLFEMGLPHVFDPTGGTGKMVEYAPFVHRNGEESIAYTSAAGVVVMKKFPDLSQPLLVVSASGSERTVEGVVNAVLRVLLLDKTPGEAAVAMSNYVSHKDGKTYCNSQDSVSFKVKFYFVCHLDTVTNGSVLGLDRSLMVAVRHYDETSIRMSVSAPHGVYNYAPGY